MRMSSSPQLVRRAIDLNYENRKRASSLRWSALNCVLLVVFAYDLSCKCPNYTSILHYVELALASVLCANLLQHAFQLLPRRQRDSVLTLTHKQQRLLGLTDTDLDSSFRVLDEPSPSRVGDISGAGAGLSGGGNDASDELNVSLSPRRAWRSAGDVSPPSPHSAHHSPSPPAASRYREPRDEFIADRHSLSDYLRQYEERSRLASPQAGVGGPPRVPRPAPHYQLALSHKESGAQEEGVGGGAGGGAGAAGGAGSPRVWWRLHLDPQHLTQFNLNLRLWLQVTILERLVREFDALDTAFAKHGLSTLKIGEVSVERLRKLAASGAGGAVSSLAALLPFLEPFPDQRYYVQRIRELSRGGCLSEYRWCGGGTGWDESKPTDAELVLSLLAAYLDGQLPAPPARPFSTLHLSAAPAPPPAGPTALAIHRVAARPPHYALALGDETLEVARGRNNLLHTILLFLAAAARQGAPHMRRMHLGPAGLNMLWIIGR